MDKKVINAFKKAFGVSLVGWGNIRAVEKQLGLRDETILSSGMFDGNFSEWQAKDGWAYTFIPYPLEDTNYVYVLVFPRRKSEDFIRKAFRVFSKAIAVAEEVGHTPKKVCWECGLPFTLWSIQTTKNTAKEAFEERLDYWLDGYCGCGG